NIEDFGNSWGINRRASVGGRLDYDYNQKYLMTLLGRYDGSYLYAEDRRWGFFPGISLGWRVTQEPFLRDRLSFLDELKLRASWGETGLEQAQAWDFLGGATYNVGNGAVLDGAMVPGSRPRGLPITNLSWVTSTSANLGIDFVLLDGRLSGEFDVFERKLTGLPAPRTDVLVPEEAGYSLPNENLNSDTNRGFEGILRWSDRMGGIFYSIAPNFTLSRQKNGTRYGERYGSSWGRYTNGNIDRWAGVNFGYQVIGQFQSVEEIDRYPVDIDGQGNRSLLPGDLIYLDVNGDRIINAMDQRPIGYSVFGTPILSFGATTSIGFAGATLSLDLAGGGLYSHSREAATKFPSGHNLPQYATDRWYRVDPYDPQSAWHEGTYPPFRNGGSRPSYNRNDDFWRTNVKFLRVRRVELGYQIPDSYSSRFGFSGLRVYTNATNPISFDNVSKYNLDPEIAFNAALNYPTVSVVNFGLSAAVGGAGSAGDSGPPRQ
ncbi:MAG TPA: hypothetical protein VMO47_16075, partial [Rhodothermales bacterium]|nr:hypothetical protein [Rhodothermales bacterium]